MWRCHKHRGSLSVYPHDSRRTTHHIWSGSEYSVCHSVTTNGHMHSNCLSNQAQHMVTWYNWPGTCQSDCRSCVSCPCKRKDQPSQQLMWLTASHLQHSRYAGTLFYFGHVRTLGLLEHHKTCIIVRWSQDNFERHLLCDCATMHQEALGAHSACKPGFHVGGVHTGPTCSTAQVCEVVPMQHF